MPRDDFSAETKRILAQRAAYICSNPDCRNNTIGPHSDPAKSLSTGIASHICAAAQGGPRYDPNQTTEERQNIANGVWLCATCSPLVDRDVKLYPAELLRKWRREHEQWVSGQEMIPKLPDLRIETAQGLSLPLVPGTITAEDCERIRERRLVLKNPNRVPLFQFDLRIQLPETIIDRQKDDIPPGVTANFEPHYPQLFASASGEGAFITRLQPPRPMTNWNLKLDHLPAREEIRITIHTITIHTIVNWFESFGPPTPEPGGPVPLDHYIRGDYFFEYRKENIRRMILVPLRYEQSSRAIESLPPQSDDAPYAITIVERFT
jgi:hypothetical protein